MHLTACHRDDTKSAQLDRYLARCVAASLRGDGTPDWPGEIDLPAAEIATRVSFHGIALLLLEHDGALRTWPKPAAQAIREEGYNQSFWETSHRETVDRLLEGLSVAGIEAIVMKGSALAYSIYTKAALRRRGDSDIVIVSGTRKGTRAVLRSCGFEPCGDVRALQEGWQRYAPPGFIHQIDLHWRINASAAISQRLEATDPFARTIELARLSPHARGLTPAQNLILICLNRTAHKALGYKLGKEKLFDGDRLIWAIDIDLITRAFGPEDWARLVDRTSVGGTSRIVASGLAFAERVCGSAIPQDVTSRLADVEDEFDLAALLDPQYSTRRFWLDLAASPTLVERARLLRHTLFPASRLLRERFPDNGGWPTALLATRRLASGFGRLFAGRV